MCDFGEFASLLQRKNYLGNIPKPGKKNKSPDCNRKKIPNNQNPKPSESRIPPKLIISIKSWIARAGPSVAECARGKKVFASSSEEKNPIGDQISRVPHVKITKNPSILATNHKIPSRIFFPLSQCWAEAFGHLFAGGKSWIPKKASTTFEAFEVAFMEL
uniref:Srb9 protein n=1 Tax=Fopius arisanus TaxID=64838 RepID=A0A0C9R0M4_9HYME